MGLRNWIARQRDTIRRPAPPPPSRAAHQQNRGVPGPAPVRQPPRQPQRPPFDPNEGRRLQLSRELEARNERFRAEKAQRERAQQARQAQQAQQARQRNRNDRSR